MKANFVKRLGAYLVDYLIITLITSLIASGLYSSKYEELSNEYTGLLEKYTSSEITLEEYTDSSVSYIYDMSKESVNSSIVGVIVMFAYYIVFQYLNKGQTIGKKILKIKVVKDNKEPSIWSIFFRSFIYTGILASIVNLVGIMLLDKNSYFILYSASSYITYGFMLVSAIMILYRKDKNGLQDIMAHTEVVEVR